MLPPCIDESRAPGGHRPRSAGRRRAKRRPGEASSSRPVVFGRLTDLLRSSPAETPVASRHSGTMTNSGRPHLKWLTEMHSPARGEMHLPRGEGLTFGPGEPRIPLTQQSVLRNS
jgi:hypothetical protein